MKIKITRSILLFTATLLLAVVKTFGQCTATQVYAVYSSSATQELIQYITSPTGNDYIEYGAPGFIPGTQGTAGVGGSLVLMQSGDYILGGLTPSTTYDFYVRRNCSGTWSPNSTVQTFITLPDCGLASVLSCGNTVTAMIPQGFPQNGYEYFLHNCGYPQNSLLKIYSFTASYSGMHVLFSSSLMSSQRIGFYWSAASGNCYSGTWNCIGNTFQNLNYPQQFSFGPLTAGSQYYIIVNKQYANDSINTDFRIECPACPQLSGFTTSNITSYSAKINFPGATTSDFVEYGPRGFIPGTQLSAGGGTIAYFSSGAVNLSNLNSSTWYDYYIRRSCSSNGFSPNSMRGEFITKQCPFTYNNVTVGMSGTLNFNGRGSYDQYPCTGTSFYASEKILKFISPATGYYSVVMTNPSYRVTSVQRIYLFAVKPSDAFCNTNNSTCFGGYQFTSYLDTRTATVGPLTAGTSYDFIFDNTDSILYSSPSLGPDLNVTIRCPQAASISSSNPQTNSVKLTWTNLNPVYLEYGPVGFSPGTDATPGTGGTVIANISSPYILTGLAADSRYDVYLRSQCGSYFTANSTVVTIQTTIDCATAPVINCGDSATFFDAAGTVGGAWSTSAANCNSYNTAKEKVWQVTPAISGTYPLLIYSLSANNIGYFYPVNFYIKLASQGCNDQNWTCVGSMNSLTTNFTPSYFSLGSLTAGTTYLLRVDGILSFQSYTYKFRIDCPNICYGPSLNTPFQSGPSSETVPAPCTTCYGSNVYVEYGPAGFTPGTGATAGVNGTLLTNVTFPVVLNGLTSGTTYDVYARKDCGAPNGFSTNSNPKTFSFCTTAPSSITASPSASVCAGTGVTLTLYGGQLPTGGSFNWYSGSCGGTFEGTGTSITVSPTASTTYYVRAEGSCGNSACINILVNVSGSLPVASITAAGNTALCPAGFVNLLAGTGTGYSYQWRMNGTNIPFANSTFSSYAANQAGSYDCVITNACGTSISNAIIITSIPAIGTGISAGGATIFCAPGSVTLSADQSPGLSYQWKLNNTDITGANAGTYNATASGLYSCAISNACTTIVTTGNVSVTVYNSPPAATINVSSGNTTFCSGGSVTLTAPAGIGFSYQWQQNSLSITGAISSSYVATSAGNYTCLVTNACGSSTSNAITVAVTLPPAASITAAGPTTFCNGSGVVLNAGSAGTISYQWRTNGTDISGATQSSYFVTTAGSYDCVMTNGCGSSTSNSIVTAIGGSLPSASITAAGPTTFCNGGSVTLNANTGAGISYHWNNNGAALSGATLASYAATSNGNYTCIETNGCGSSTSNNIMVTVNIPPSATITAAGAITFCSGGSVTLNANTGAGITYQWNKNGAAITGATITSYAANSTGNYTCIEANGCGSSTSNAITVTVNSPPSASITASGPTTFCTGGSVNLNANTGSGLSYQWRLNGINISGGTSASYVASAAGTYSCIVSNTCGSSTSNNLSVIVNSTTAPGNISGQTQGVCSSVKTYSISLVPGASSYAWTVPAGAAISSGQGTVSVNISFNSSFASGIISVAAVNNCGSSSSTTLSVSAVPAQPGTITGRVSVCQNQNNVAYSIAAVAGATSYTWTVPSGATIRSGQGTASIKVRFGTAAGNITVTANNNCGSGTVRTLAVVMPCREREEEDLTENAFQPGIYPNPSALNFTLQSEIEPEKEIALTIFDIAGKAIESFKNIRSTSFTFGENLSPGIYFAEIISGNNRKIIKLVKDNY